MVEICTSYICFYQQSLRGSSRVFRESLRFIKAGHESELNNTERGDRGRTGDIKEESSLILLR